MRSAPTWSVGWSVSRLVAGLLIAAAIIAQATRTIGGAIDRSADVATTAVNFFSFFTVLSNLFSVVVLLIVGLLGVLRRGEPDVEPFALDVARACVMTYMIVTGVVYNLLLRGVALPQGTTVPWSNEVLHVVGPLFLLVDVLFGSNPPRLPWRSVLGILIFPIVWVVYTLVRGPMVTNPVTGAAWWYPYPFLDPHVVNGYAGVVPYVIGIAVALGAFALGVVYVGRRRTVGPAPEAEPVSPAGQVL